MQEIVETSPPGGRDNCGLIRSTSTSCGDKVPRAQVVGGQTSHHPDQYSEDRKGSIICLDIHIRYRQTQNTPSLAHRYGMESKKLSDPTRSSELIT